ncbi:hypothetical protein FHS08_002418 [Microbacterium ulmi]|nr:hypothetical protein [Microbacterium ulmi]
MAGGERDPGESWPHRGCIAAVGALLVLLVMRAVRAVRGIRAGASV